MPFFMSTEMQMNAARSAWTKESLLEKRQQAHAKSIESIEKYFVNPSPEMICGL